MDMKLQTAVGVTRGLMERADKEAFFTATEKDALETIIEWMEENA